MGGYVPDGERVGDGRGEEVDHGIVNLREDKENRLEC